jgi:sugar lactone lactonase YvrE
MLLIAAGLLACLLASPPVPQTRAAAQSAAAEDAGDSCAELLGLMYWTKYDEGVYRACRDGSEVKLLVPMKGADGLAIDEQAGKLYFTVSAAPTANADSAYRAKLDGSGVEELIKGLNYTGDLQIDAKAGKLYVSCMGDGKIIEAKLDGSGQKDLIVGLGNPDEMTIDLVHRKLYWVRGGMIQRGDLDGANVEDFVPIQAMSMGLAVDPDDKRLYYVVTGAGSIRRIKLDGTGDEQILDGHLNTDGLALDAGNRKLYWTEQAKICQSNLDGSLVETLVPDKTSKYGSIVILPPKSSP